MQVRPRAEVTGVVDRGLQSYRYVPHLTVPSSLWRCHVEQQREFDKFPRLNVDTCTLSSYVHHIC